MKVEYPGGQLRFVGFAYAALLFVPLAAFRIGVSSERRAEPAPEPILATSATADALEATTPTDADGQRSGEGRIASYARPTAEPLAGRTATRAQSPDASVEASLEPQAGDQLPERQSDALGREPQSAEQSQRRQSVQESRDRRDSRDWRRRRRRNRYPGPIPTPEDWAPPEGPVKIALQAGHWRAHEAPSELSGLRGGGTRWQSTAEWETNLEIAQRAGAMLEELGYEVDILPAVVPPSYRAHLFISIHADGSADPRASGYRVAAPRSDATGRAERAAALLEDRYGDATGLSLIPTVTRRMRNYYAFNFRRYEHALHPLTIAVILETGFITSSSDRAIIMDAPERAARGIVDAVVAFPETSLQTVVAEGQR
jgi:N-acetylmuramoyl-L-alanine amidase